MSLRKIVKQVGLPKGTVYYHIRKTFGRKIQPLRLNIEPNERLGEFLGLFASDGSYSFAHRSYHYRLELDLSDYQIEYALKVSDMIQEIFGKKPRIWVDKKAHMIQVRLYGKSISKVLRKFLRWRGRRTYTISFREDVLDFGMPFLKGIIRGLVAGDGSVYVPKSRISFGVVSAELARQYSSMLTRFGILSHSYTTHPRPGRHALHVVYISGADNVEKFKLRVSLTDPAKRKLLEAAAMRR